MKTRVQKWLANFNQFSKRLADQRFSELQKQAFKKIRGITRYNQFMVHDGSIITAVRMKDGTLITEPYAVADALITVLEDNEKRILKENINSHNR